MKTEQDFGVAKRAPFVLLYLLKAARRLVATWPDGLEATTGAHEIQFWICSQDCAKALWQAIEQEQDGFLLAQVWNPDLCV